MLIEIKVPGVGESVTEALLAQWFKNDGDLVKKDEPLFVIETDKVTLEVVAEADGVLSIKVSEGETVAIVGESGCGKSTFAKVLMGLEKGTEGEIRHKGKDISDTAVRDRSSKQISSLQMVFQNPFDTLNPSHSIGGQISRVIKRFGGITDKKALFDRVMTLQDTVKLPRDFYFRNIDSCLPDSARYIDYILIYERS